jgi:flagellar biosynthesis/type III secretory pathway protein FliH
VLRKSAPWKKKAEAGAYLYAVLEANIETLREVLTMGELTLEKVLEESGLTAKWEERGEVRGKTLGKAEGIAQGKAQGMAQGKAMVRQVLDLLKSGKPPEEILKLYGEAAS